MVIYELHVRDFSINDATVSPAHRGKYLAFTEQGSNGMKHLRSLAKAGLTDVHLLPIFDIATIPEVDCVTPQLTGGAADESQQAALNPVRDKDCYNWGYDPLHYTAPEGSYATDANDGLKRVRELRQMVQALHRADLRVGMDVVYNHTPASGQSASSVLDRIVPGYYQRLNLHGKVETSTCCPNTATEHPMMAKLMSDSVLVWARDYRIDSFRFDLMGHQPRLAMEQIQRRLRRELGRDVQLIGEGWNFGEVANGARFVQAAQGRLGGTGIGTFSDRGRDAIRGGSAGDSGAALVERQGYVNGLGYAPHEPKHGVSRAADAAALRHAADLVRAGLAGTLKSYPLHTASGAVVPLEKLDYNGQGAGYAEQPGEVVNYVENHDNQTLYDLHALRLPMATSSTDRARVQVLALALNAFSQGVAYFHAGTEILRSKSLDRNSFNSGDWFNRLDWTYQDNFFATGLPPASDNEQSWAQMRTALLNPNAKPTPQDIAFTRDAFLDLLRIRASSSLFRLNSSHEIRQRLRFLNTGPQQVPTVVAAYLDGARHPGASFKEIVYLVNVDTVPRQVADISLRNKSFALHPVHRAADAADRRIVQEARYAAEDGSFTVPARSAAVFVVN